MRILVNKHIALRVTPILEVDIYNCFKEVLKSAEIAVNEVLDVTVSNGVIMLVKQFRHKTLEERAAEFDGKLNLDGE